MAKDRKKITAGPPLNSRLNHACVKPVLLIIRLYRYLLSPWLGNQCRFSPSCSHYAEEAYQQHGLFKGTWLTLRRLLKCNPWHQGGFDPVPAARHRETTQSDQKTNYGCSHSSPP
ncbi:MAG: membrane protein insertion efficiency factor YidD [Cellvibrionaceae bacterium]|nr:membrane protein insertion efficiency factor YidD [Cellvibrionaceae bacterium]